MIKYKGLITRNPNEAIEYYRKRFGVNPTIILARPETILENEPDILVRTKHCIAFGLMLAHEVTPTEFINNGIKTRDRKLGIQKVRMQEENGPDEIEPKPPVVYKTKTKKKALPDPEKAKSRMCPHCGSRVKDFNHLGYWYGWSLGITPPYWDELREYVFKRDNYICTSCHTKTQNPHCHHVMQKEFGGTDSARNLTTLCSSCHTDYQPIMPDDLFGTREQSAQEYIIHEG